MAWQFKMHQQRKEDRGDAWQRSHPYNGCTLVVWQYAGHWSWLALGYKLQHDWPLFDLCLCGEVAWGDFEFPPSIWGDDSDTWWCVMFVASPHWWHASVPRGYHTGRPDGVDDDALGVWSGSSSCWGDEDQRCTLLIWLLAKDFQAAYEGAVRVGDWAWCDSGGAEDAWPSWPHIFAILGEDHALHWQDPECCGCCLPEVL